MKLASQQHQAGVGLIEVLVSLLILAVAILGFSAVQMNAMRTTDESILRSRAMTVMRSGAEVMRSNHQTISDFKEELNKLNKDKSDKVAISDQENCLKKDANCNPKQLAKYDATVLYNYAIDNEVRINMDNCSTTSSNQDRQCMIVSWGETAPTFGSDADTDCASSNRLYHPKATCFIMEAY